MRPATKTLIAARALTGAIFAVAVTVLSLWLFAPPSTIAVLSLMMKANTSFGLVLLASSLWLVLPPEPSKVRRRLSIGLAAVGATVGVLSIAQYAVGHSLGIDELIRSDIPAPESFAFPGRIAPNTAGGLALLGLGIILLDVRPVLRRHTAEVVFVIVLLLTAIALVGYAFQVNALYQIASYLRMSQYTAAAMLLLSVAGLLARPENHAVTRVVLSAAPDGSVVRRLLPAAVLTPILFCWLAVQVRAHDVANRPTTFSVLAVSLAVIFSALIFLSARAVARTDGERRRALEQEKTTLATINRVGQALVAERELEKLVQSVTDAATQLTGAQFGAFFYNVQNAAGESYSLYTLSGVPRDTFSRFPMPRNTAVFRPTFSGEATVRSDDITADPRYGKNPPHRGMPEGHLPVRSYLAVPVVSRGGEVLGGLFFGHSDVGRFSETAEKLVEGLAAQAAIGLDNAHLYQRLQESIRVRDEFLSIASHELKTPLTSLNLQWDLMRRRIAPEAGGQVDQMIGKQQRQLRRLGRLVDEMLDLSRLSLGKFSVDREAMQLADLVSEVVERHRPDFDAAGVPLTLKLDSPAPGHWDRLRLEQVVTNLLTNAVRYGEGQPVEVSLRADEKRTLLEVVDRGRGIARQDHERIFLPFERAVAARDISGLGLGLYITREIIRRHGGEIRVESEPGKGARFIVELPAATASAPPS